MADLLTPDERAIVERVKKSATCATPGRWQHVTRGRFAEPVVETVQLPPVAIDAGGYRVALLGGDGNDYDIAMWNGSFLAHAREDVPALLAILDRLTAAPVSPDVREVVDPHEVPCPTCCAARGTPCIRRINGRAVRYVGVEPHPERTARAAGKGNDR